MKFVFITEFFESSALALWLKIIEGRDVKVLVRNTEYNKILDGFISKEKSVFKFLGEGNVFITDDAESGEIAEDLRKKGEMVFGGNVLSDKMENDRQFGQSIMKQFGIKVPPSKNFKGMNSFEEAIDFVKKSPKRYVIKQNGNQDKSYSSVGKFGNGQDIMDKLIDFKHTWEGEIDFDLQEFIDGHECACEGFFNGLEWLRDKKGEPVFLINFEHKKKSEGDTGRTTGETGTLAYRLKKDSAISKELIKITPYLKQIKYIGNVDINFELGRKDLVFYGLEFTMRFGYPALNYQMEMMKNSWTKALIGTVKGENNFLEYDPRWSIVIVLQVPPFPFETTKDSNNAKGQRIYFTENGNITNRDELTPSKLRHIHLYETKFEKETKHYICTGNTGYLMTVTAQADTIEQTNKKCLDYIKNNVYTSNMDYRKDIGVNQRVKETIEVLHKNSLI